MFDQRQCEQRDGRKDGVHFLLWWVRALAAISWPFTRRDTGPECPGSCAVGTIAVLVAVATWTNSVLAWPFFFFWVVGLLRLRAKLIQNKKQGKTFPVRWDGIPWLAQKLLPRVKDLSNLKGYESFLVASIGVALTYVDPAVGGLLIASAIASFCVEAVAVQVRKNRVAAMREANWELQQLSDDYQSGRF
jgi:hypothetical protein